jgi:hypothetical protein
MTVAQFCMRFALVVLTLGLLSGCPSVRDEVKHAGNIGENEVIIVGKLEMVPALTTAEQHSSVPEIHLIVDDKLRIFEGRPTASDEFMIVNWGELFFRKNLNKTLYILIGRFFTSGSGVDEIFLPGIQKITIQSNDKAVYIGTIRYTRNEYFDITKTEIIDDFNKANTEFRKKFGSSIQLRKSLAIQMTKKTR